MMIMNLSLPMNCKSSSVVILHHYQKNIRYLHTPLTDLGKHGILHLKIGKYYYKWILSRERISD